MDSNKKKIIFLISSFPVFSETFIEREVNALILGGNFDIQIISFKKDSEFNYKHLSDKVSYIDLTFFDILSGFSYFLTNNFNALISTLWIMLGNKNKKTISNMYLWLKSVGYAFLFSKYTPQQIHVHFFSDASTICYLASILLNTKYSLSGHAKDIFDSNNLPDLISQKLDKATFAVVCNKKAFSYCSSHTTIKNLAKLHLEYHGVDFTAISKYKTEVSIPNAIPILYFIGRFVPKKGVIYLLDALRILSLKNARLRLVLAGFGEEYDSYLDFINKNKLSEMVTFANGGVGISNDESLKYMSQADVVVVPSIDLASGDSDGIPNTILEAGLLNKPVITTNAGSISELVVHNQTGLIVEQKNSLKLSEEILKLITNPDLAKTLGQNLYNAVYKDFNLHTNIAKLEDLLRL